MRGSSAQAEVYSRTLSAVLAVVFPSIRPCGAKLIMGSRTEVWVFY